MTEGLNLNVARNKMKRLFLIAAILTIPAYAMANDTIDEAVKEEGAVKTSSGMVYIPIMDGKGRSPGISDKVVVNYRGTLKNGTEFDKGKSTTFPLSGVIPCWTLGLQYMKAGGKAKLVCPPDQAYGPKGAGLYIPPNATLIFEIELLRIK